MALEHRDELFAAAQQGNRDDVDTLLRILRSSDELPPSTTPGSAGDSNATPTLHMVDEEGLTLMHVACRAGHVDVVRVLIDHGAAGDDPAAQYITGGINDRDEGKERYRSAFTPLFYACGGLDASYRDRPRCALVKLLLENGADKSVNALSPNHESGTLALYAACSCSDSTAVIRQLLEHGAKPVVPELKTGFPLHRACDLAKVEAVKVLLEHGAGECVNQRDEAHWHASAILLACKSPRARTSASEESESRSDDHSRLQEPQGEIVRMLLDHGAMPSIDRPVDGDTPLEMAVKKGHVDAVRVLMTEIERITREQCEKDGGNANEECPAIAAARRRQDMEEGMGHIGFDVYGEDLLAADAKADAERHAHDPIQLTSWVEKQSSFGGRSGRLTALHWAALYDHLDVLRVLLEEFSLPRGFVNSQDNDGITPLHVARSGEIIALLLANGAKESVNLVSRHNAVTPLGEFLFWYQNNRKNLRNGVSGKPSTAQEHKEHSVSGVEAVRILLENGAEETVNTVSGTRSSSCGNLPLHLAYVSQDVDMVRLLLEHGAVESIPRLLHIVSSALDADMLRLMIDAGGAVAREEISRQATANSDSVLLSACSRASVSRSSPKSDDPSRDTKIVGVLQLLLDNGAENTINTQGGMYRQHETPLQAACAKGFPLAAVKLLLEAGATETINATNRRGYTALHSASGCCHASVVRELLENGALEVINMPTLCKRTPLLEACNSGWGAADVDIVQLLLDHGAHKSVNQADDNGNTVFHNYHGMDPMVVRMLLCHGADASVNARNKDGNTPLQHLLNGEKRTSGHDEAQAKRIVETVRLLLSNGAREHMDDVGGEQTRPGRPPLQLAFRALDPFPAHRRELLSLLIHNGANIEFILDTEEGRFTFLYFVVRGLQQDPLDACAMCELLLRGGLLKSAEDVDAMTKICELPFRAWVGCILNRREWPRLLRDLFVQTEVRMRQAHSNFVATFLGACCSGGGSDEGRCGRAAVGPSMLEGRVNYRSRLLVAEFCGALTTPGDFQALRNAAEVARRVTVTEGK